MRLTVRLKHARPQHLSAGPRRFSVDALDGSAAARRDVEEGHEKRGALQRGTINTYDYGDTSKPTLVICVSAPEDLC
jgi:hypothetical protein